MNPLTWPSKIGTYCKDNIAFKKLILVVIFTVLVMGGGLWIGYKVADDKQLLVAGAVVAAFGKLSEIAAKTKDVQQAGDKVKDGLALFAEGATFFGLLMAALGAIFALDT